MADSYEIILPVITFFHLYSKKYERDSNKARNYTNRIFPSVSCLNYISVDDSVLECTNPSTLQKRKKKDCGSSALKKSVTSQKNVLSQKTGLIFTSTVNQNKNFCVHTFEPTDAMF